MGRTEVPPARLHASLGIGLWHGLIQLERNGALLRVHALVRPQRPLTEPTLLEMDVVTSPESAVTAERFVAANSGKVLDGIHTSFNRRLCRPFVRLLSHTPVTPNAVTFGGVVISILSAVAFGRGTYLWSVLGAFIFYIAGLFDEMDGMLARIKFAESPRGTWLEGMADGLSYLLLFGGSR